MVGGTPRLSVLQAMCHGRKRPAKSSTNPTNAPVSMGHRRLRLRHYSCCALNIRLRPALTSNFYLDLRDIYPDRQRITDKLVAQAIDLCQSRGIQADRSGDGLTIVVDLYRCYLNPRQAADFNTALDYTRTVHGNQL